MDDIIFLKYTNDIRHKDNGEGEYQSYFLGALFYCTKAKYQMYKENGRGRSSMTVLNTCGHDYLGAVFSTNINELTIVDNDIDLNRCIELYTMLEERNNERNIGRPISTPPTARYTYTVDSTSSGDMWV